MISAGTKRPRSAVTYGHNAGHAYQSKTVLDVHGMYSSCLCDFVCLDNFLELYWPAELFRKYLR